MSEALKTLLQDPGSEASGNARWEAQKVTTAGWNDHDQRQLLKLGIEVAESTVEGIGRARLKFDISSASTKATEGIARL